MKITLRTALTAICMLLLSFTAIAQDQLPVLRITYSGSLNGDTYIPGTMQLTDVDGTVVELPTQFKIRGATAKSYTKKPSMNMRIRNADNTEIDTTILGLRQASAFILDAMAIDRINMRNRVSFDVWNAFSKLPYETQFGSRNGTVGKFVEVYINGSYRGIYCLTDKINRKLLGLKKPKTDDNGNLTAIRGVLYKNGTTDYGNQNTAGYFNDYMVYVTRYHDAWELKEPDDYPCLEAWTPLTELFTNNNYGSPQYIRDHFYFQNLADYTIFVLAFAITDNWGNKNKYFSVYNIIGTGDETRFVLTPWDLDTSLGGHYNGDNYGGSYGNWPVRSAMNNCPVPISTIAGQADFKELLRNDWIRARWGAFAVDSVKERLQDYCNLFINSGAWQRTVELNSGNEKIVRDLQTEVDYIIKWYARRYELMDEYFGTDDSSVPSELDNIISTSDINSSDIIYTLQGVRINHITQPGLYIINGKKMMISNL